MARRLKPLGAQCYHWHFHRPAATVANLRTVLVSIGGLRVGPKGSLGLSRDLFIGSGGFGGPTRTFLDLAHGVGGTRLELVFASLIQSVSSCRHEYRSFHDQSHKPKYWVAWVIFLADSTHKCNTMNRFHYATDLIDSEYIFIGVAKSSDFLGRVFNLPMMSINRDPALGGNGSFLGRY